jgi:hypothetical protein
MPLGFSVGDQPWTCALLQVLAAGTGPLSPFAALRRIRPISEGLLPRRRRSWHACSCRVGPGSCTPSPSQIRTGYSRIIRLVPPHEGCRLPLNEGLLPANRLAQNQRRWPAPFAPRPLQPLQHYYRAVRPSPAHRYFRPCGCSRLRLFPWHRRPGSHVPYQSLIELRAAYTPGAARSVSGHPPS